MATRECSACRHKLAGQCQLKWPDRTFSDRVVERQINAPAEHVRMFWCHGDKWEGSGLSYNPYGWSLS